MRRKPVGPPSESAQELQKLTDTIVKHTARDKRTGWKHNPDVRANERLSASLQRSELPKVASVTKTSFFAQPTELLAEEDRHFTKSDIAPGTFVEIRRYVM